MPLTLLPPPLTREDGLTRRLARVSASIRRVVILRSLAWLIMGSAGGSHYVAMGIFGAGLFLLDLSAMVFFINYLSLRQALTPDPLLGRVTATMIALTVSTAPLGGLAGGWVAEHWGLRTAVLLAGAGAVLLAPLLTMFSPIARMRELPRPHEPAIESVTEELSG